jgi:hypothetical protein
MIRMHQVAAQKKGGSALADPPANPSAGGPPEGQKTLTSIVFGFAFSDLGR